MGRDVGVGQLVDELQQRGDRLPFEVGAFVALEACEGLLQHAVRLNPNDVRVTLEGLVVVSPKAERSGPDEAARSLVSVLSRLLIAAGPGVPPSLVKIVEDSTLPDREQDLQRLHDMIEASLIPLNRGASRRILARLVRESERPAAPEPTIEAAELDAELDALLQAGLETEERAPSQPGSTVPRARSPRSDIHELDSEAATLPGSVVAAVPEREHQVPSLEPEVVTGTISTVDAADEPDTVTGGVATATFSIPAPETATEAGFELEPETVTGYERSEPEPVTASGSEVVTAAAPEVVTAAAPEEVTASAPAPAPVTAPEPEEVTASESEEVTAPESAPEEVAAAEPEVVTASESEVVTAPESASGTESTSVTVSGSESAPAPEPETVVGYERVSVEPDVFTESQSVSVSHPAPESASAPELRAGPGSVPASPDSALADTEAATEHERVTVTASEHSPPFEPEPITAKYPVPNRDRAATPRSGPPGIAHGSEAPASDALLRNKSDDRASAAPSTDGRPWRALLLIALAAVVLWGLAQSGTFDALLTPTPSATELAPPTGRIAVTVYPEDAQVFIFEGRGPAVAEGLSVKGPHEFIVFDRGLQPSRALVPAGARWLETDEGPLYELAVQSELVADASEPDLDLGQPLSEGEPPSGGSLGRVRVVTNPPQAKVYRLIGLGPEVAIDGRAIHEGHEVLAFHPEYSTRRAVIGPSDWRPSEDDASEAVVEIRLPQTASGPSTRTP